MQVHVHSVRVHVEAGDQHRVSSLIVHLIFFDRGSHTEPGDQQFH